MLSRNRRRTFVCWSFLIALSAASAHAQFVRTWDGNDATDLFEAPANWSDNLAPGLLDTARFSIPVTDPYSVLWDNTTGDWTNASLQVLAGNVTFRRDSGDARTYSVISANLDAGRLQITDLTLAVAATTTINNGGRLDVNAAGRFAGGLTSNLVLGASGAGALYINIAGTVGVGSVASLATAADGSLVVSDAVVGGVGGGTLSVGNGSSVTNGGRTNIGPDANGGRFGRIVVGSAGAMSKFTATGAMTVGRYGVLDVQPGALVNCMSASATTVAAGGKINLTGGELRTASLDLGATSDALAFSGGKLSTKTVTGSIVQTGGTLAPGGTRGTGSGAGVSTFAISGDYTMSGGSIEIEQGAGSDDQVVVDGQLTLTGNLSLKNAGFSPTLGDHFRIMAATSRVGRFTSVSGLSYSPNISFAITYEVAAGTPSVYYTAAIPGDATLDRNVSFDDLVILAQNYGGRDKEWSTGDFDGSGVVDFNDLVLFAQHYAQSGLALPAGTPSGFAADWALAQSLVPEPASLVVLPALVAIARRRR